MVAAGLLPFWGDRAELPDDAVTGADPRLLPPTRSLIPTVNIAPAKGWPDGMSPLPERRW